MKRDGIFIILCLLFYLPGISQIEERERRILSPIFSEGIVETSELPPPGTIGTIYIYDDWNLGSVVLKSQKSIKNVPLKYDLHNNYLEVSFNKVIKVIYSEKIKYFEWLNSVGKTETYYNIDEFKSEEDISGGFFEIILEGKLKLVAVKEVKYMSPNYNQTLDAGNEEGRYINKEKYYYIDQHITAKKIPRKKKEFYKIFGSTSQDIESYVKSKIFGIKGRYELKKIFEFNNSLLAEL